MRFSWRWIQLEGEELSFRRRSKEKAEEPLEPRLTRGKGTGWEEFSGPCGGFVLFCFLGGESRNRSSVDDEVRD